MYIWGDPSLDGLINGNEWFTTLSSPVFPFFSTLKAGNCLSLLYYACLTEKQSISLLYG